MVIEKWYNRMMVTLTNHVIVRARSILREPLAIWRFFDIFLPKIGKGQKKSHHLSTEPLALCLMVIPPMVFALHS